MKFKIKALDDANLDLRNKIVDKLKELGYTLTRSNNANSYFKINYTLPKNKDLDYYAGYFEINYNPRAVRKVDTNIWNYRKFTKEELKFFDMLDFEIEREQAKATEQDITDWIGM